MVADWWLVWVKLGTGQVTALTRKDVGILVLTNTGTTFRYLGSWLVLQ